MKAKIFIFLLFAAMITMAAAVPAQPTLESKEVVSVSISEVQIQRLSNGELNKLAKSVFDIALISPTKGNSDAYVAVQRELSRRGLASSK